MQNFSLHMTVLLSIKNCDLQCNLRGKCHFAAYYEPDGERERIKYPTLIPKILYGTHFLSSQSCPAYPNLLDFTTLTTQST